MTEATWENSRMRELCEWSNGLIQAELEGNDNEELHRFATDFLAAVSWTYEQNSSIPWNQVAWSVVTTWRSDKSDFLNLTLQKFQNFSPSADRDFSWNILSAHAQDVPRFLMAETVAMVAMMNAAGIKLPGQPS
jgi:hypothetical protein